MTKQLLIAALFCMAAFTLTACKDDKNEQPPVVIEQPTATPIATATPPPHVGRDAEYCNPVGKTIKCGHAQWFNLDCGQGLNADGSASASGDYTSYFKDLAEAEALSKRTGVTARIKMKDGSVVQYGVGFAAPCSEL